MTFSARVAERHCAAHDPWLLTLFAAGRKGKPRGDFDMVASFQQADGIDPVVLREIHIARIPLDADPSRSGYRRRSAVILER